MKKSTSSRGLREPEISARPLFLMFVSISFAFVLMEVVVRAAMFADLLPGEREQWSPMSESSVTRHHALLPNATRRHVELEYDYVWANNSLGMRDRERTVSIGRDRPFKILFLGDSMVQGYGVALEESMVYLLERQLNQPPRRQRIDVLNAGVFGYSPMLEYLYLTELAPMVEPDLVMVGFFVANDVGDDQFYQQRSLKQSDGTLAFQDEEWPWTAMNELLDSRLQSNTNSGRAGNFALGKRIEALAEISYSHLLKRSRLVSLLTQGSRNRDARAALAERAELERVLVDEFKSDPGVNLGLINYPVLDKETRFQQWQVSLDYLSKIQRLTDELGIPMILVVIPILEPEVHQFLEPYDVLDAFGARNSIPVIQLLPDFQKHLAEELMYPLDGHWNSAGNRIAADSIVQHLRETGLARLLPPVLRPNSGDRGALRDRSPHPPPP